MADWFVLFLCAVVVVVGWVALEVVADHLDSKRRDIKIARIKAANDARISTKAEHAEASPIIEHPDGKRFQRNEADQWLPI